MKKILALEEAAQCAIALSVLYFQPVSLQAWLWVLLFFLPDLSMLGYLAGSRAGAFLYNLAHHKGLAIAVITVGWLLKAPLMSVAGYLLYAHSSFDRMMGYGLKYEQGFAWTHLGRIGKEKKQLQ